MELDIVASRDDLETKLGKLEEARQEMLSKIKYALAIIFLICGVVAAYFYLTESLIAMAITLVAGTVCVFLIKGFLLGKVKTAFKQQVMPFILADIDSSLAYEVSDYIDRQEFIASNLFIKPDRFSGKDLVKGCVGDTKIQFSLIVAEEEYEESSTDANGKTTKETKYRTIFKGLFFIADFNKAFAGRTLVTPHAVTFFRKLFGSHVALEDTEFNKNFTVTSTDQVEARYIMTPALMERLKTLRSKVGAFRASFVAGNLFMAVNMPLDAFEPKMSKSLADSEQVRKIQSNIRAITGIVEDLGLNVRIWTK